MKKAHSVLVLAMFAGMLTGNAIAQLAPPPSQKEKERATAPTPEAPAAPAAAPARPTTPPPPKPTLVVPDIAVRDAEGKVVRRDLLENIDIASFAANVLVDNATWERCLPEIKAWMGEVEAQAIDNLDLVMEVDAGFFDTLDINDRPQIAYAAELVKPLTHNAQLSKYLLEKAAISRAQFDQNNKIVAKHDQAVFTEVLESPEIKNAVDPAVRAGAMARHMFSTSTREVRRAYTRLVRETAANFDKVVADAKIPVAKLDKAQVAIVRDRAATPEARQDAVRALLKSMEFTEAQKLLWSTSKLYPAGEPAWAPKAEGTTTSTDDAAR